MTVIIMNLFIFAKLLFLTFIDLIFKNMKYLTFIAAIILSSSAAADQWVGPVDLKQLVTGYKDKFLLFSTSGEKVTLGSCHNTAYYSVEKDNADLESVLSILLFSKATGRKISFAVDGDRCGSNGIPYLEGQPSVSRVRID
ncbi:hypothetical protein A3759_03520 [Thalassolituus sp. HI0120]|nr:hypothetical protein A3759_03520 [Thalassolituus sp. HI0120]